MSKEAKKCGHESCRCMTTEGYCSEMCRDSKDVTDLTCQCGHSGCSSGLKA